MAVELLEAIARFRADTTDITRGIAAVEAQAKQAATRVESVFAGRRQTPTIQQQEFADIKRASTELDALRAKVRGGEQAAKGFGVSFGQATGAVKELGFDIAQSLDPALAGLVRDLAGAGSAAKQMGLAFGGVAAVAAAVAFGIDLLARRAQEAEKFQTALNEAFRTNDPGRLSSVLGELASQMATFNVRTATAAQQIRDLDDATQVIFAFWRSAFGPSITDLQTRAERASTAFADLFLSLEQPAKALAAQRELLQIQSQQLANEQKGATTQRLINQLGEERIRQLNTQQAVALAGIQLERQRQIAQRTADLVGPAKERVAEAINQEFDLRIETERRRFAEERRVVEEENRKLAAERTAIRFEDLAKEVEAQRARVQGRNAATRQILDLEKQLGTDLAAIHVEERARIEEDVRVQAAALEEQTALQSAAFRARIQAASADQRPQLERQFTDFLRDQESKRLELRQQAAVQLAQLEQKQADERIRREQETTEHLARFGQATIAEQVRLLQRIVGDETLSLATRRKAAEDLQARQVQLEEQRFQILRDLGVQTTQAEIQRQLEVANAVQQGSQKQIDAIQKIIQLRRQSIEEARQQAQSLLGFGDQDEEVTAFDVQRQALERQREAALTINRAGAGGTFTRAELSRALADQRALADLAPTGFSIGGLLGQATQPLLTPELQQQATQAIETLGEKAKIPIEPVRESLKSVTDAYEETFARLPEVVQASMDKIAETIRSGNDAIVEGLAERTLREVARAIQLERARN